MLYKYLLVWILAARDTSAQGVLDSLFADPVVSSLTGLFETATDSAVKASASSELASRVNGALSSANGAFASTGAAAPQPSATEPVASAASVNSAAPAPSSISSTPELSPSQASVPSAVIATPASLGVQSSGTIPTPVSVTAQQPSLAQGGNTPQSPEQSSVLSSDNASGIANGATPISQTGGALAPSILASSVPTTSLNSPNAAPIPANGATQLGNPSAPIPPPGNEPNLPVGPNGAPIPLGFTPQVSLATPPQLGTSNLGVATTSTSASLAGPGGASQPASVLSEFPTAGVPPGGNSQVGFPPAAGGPSGPAVPLSTPQITGIPHAPVVSGLPNALVGLAESFANNPGVRSLSNLWATATDENVRADISAGISQVFAMYLSIAREAAANAPVATAGSNGRPFPVQPQNSPAAGGIIPNLAGSRIETATEAITSTPGADSVQAFSVATTAVLSISDGTIATTTTVIAATTVTEEDTGAAVGPGSLIVTPAPVPRAPESVGQGLAGGNANATINNTSGSGAVIGGALNTNNNSGVQATGSLGSQPLAPAPVPAPLATNYPNGNPNENPNGGNLSGGSLGGRPGNENPGNDSSPGSGSPGSGGASGPRGGNSSAGNPRGGPPHPGGLGGGALGGGAPGNGNGIGGNSTGSQPPLFANGAASHSPITLSLIVSLILAMLTV